MHKVIDVEPGLCRGGVSPWLPTGKVWRGGDGSFCGLWVRSDARRSSSGKRETRYQLLTGQHRDGTCNRLMTLLTGWPVGENEETYINGLDANDIQTDTAAQPVWAIAVFRGMILTFIPLGVARYKCDSSLQQFDFWSSWCFELSRASFSFPPWECVAKWTWDSLVVSTHFAVEVLIRQSCCILLTAVPCTDEM